MCFQHVQDGARIGSMHRVWGREILCGDGFDFKCVRL